MIKVYSLGNDGHITPATARVLGLTRHQHQARVLVAATSKSHAIELLRAAGMPAPSLKSHEFREAAGDDVDALRAAGQLLEAGWIFCLSPHRLAATVVAIHSTPDGLLMEVRGVLVDGGKPHTLRLAEFPDE